MAVPNMTELATTTIQHRSRKLADNVTKNNAFFTWLKKSGNVKTAPGGTEIVQEFTFAENGNFQFYSGYDQLQMGPQDVISAAVFPWKQAAVAVQMSGLEGLQNTGRERQIDLMEGRVGNAETTMINNLSNAVYSDGSGWGGKQVEGLASAVSATGIYGGIDRGTWAFWKAQVQDAWADNGNAAPTKDSLRVSMTKLYAKLVRGADRPKLGLFDSILWQTYVDGLQILQRFSGTDEAGFGFPSVKFMDMDIVLDGGIGGFCPTSTGFFLNPKYLFFRPHADRNMVPLNPSKRTPINQDAEVQLIGWAGNITSNGCQFQGRIKGTA